MNTVSVICPACLSDIKVSRKSVGQRILCPKCNTQFKAKQRISRNYADEAEQSVSSSFYIRTGERRGAPRVLVRDVSVDLGVVLGTGTLKDINEQGVGLSPLDSDYELQIGQVILFTIISRRYEIKNVKARVVRLGGHGIGCQFEDMDRKQIKELIKVLESENDWEDVDDIQYKVGDYMGSVKSK